MIWFSEIPSAVLSGILLHSSHAFTRIPLEELQTSEFLAFTMIPIWYFSMLFFWSIVQMGFEGRDAGVVVRREREQRVI